VSAAPRLVGVDDVIAQPWRNGGGRTRELLAWPSADDWRLRISVADIDADGPFSAFPGVERWFAVIDGAGVVLRFGHGERRVVAGDAPLRFDGAAAPECLLIAGPTRDLNLMLRGGATGGMRAAQRGEAWQAASSGCGLFAAQAGRLTAGGESWPLPARTLLWFEQAPSGALRFETGGAPQGSIGWWLSFDANEG